MPSGMPVSLWTNIVMTGTPSPSALEIPPMTATLPNTSMATPSPLSLCAPIAGRHAVDRRSFSSRRTYRASATAMMPGMYTSQARKPYRNWSGTSANSNASSLRRSIPNGGAFMNMTGSMYDITTRAVPSPAVNIMAAHVKLEYCFCSLGPPSLTVPHGEIAMMSANKATQMTTPRNSHPKLLQSRSKSQSTTSVACSVNPMRSATTRAMGTTDPTKIGVLTRCLSEVPTIAPLPRARQKARKQRLEISSMLPQAPSSRRPSRRCPPTRGSRLASLRRRSLRF